MPQSHIGAAVTVHSFGKTCSTGITQAAIIETTELPAGGLFGKESPARFRPISSDSAVAVLIGKASASEDSEADISLITPDQVLTAWKESTR
jgi:hypothetical protein